MSTASDLERAGLAAADTNKGAYGSIDKKVPDEAPLKLPLLLGYWQVSPDQLFRIGLGAYISWFVVYRVADLVYIATVDARFPEGLGHLYPSEAQRMDSVNYTQQVLLCGMLQKTVAFCVVLALVFFKGFARVDEAMCAFPAWMESSATFGSKYRWCVNFMDHVWNGRLATQLWNTWLGRVLSHVYHGRLATQLCDRIGFPLSLSQLLRGAVYLSLFGCLFFAVGAPFIYWRQFIDLKFGFANSLSVSLGNFQGRVFASLFSMLLFSWPKKFMMLAVLQYRLGWLLMWFGLIAGVIFSQMNVKNIAPMMGLNAVFPEDHFAVGRGFPLVQTKNPYAPWISLNRIYWEQKLNPYAALSDNKDVPEKFFTNDKSKGQLFLTHEKSGEWSIAASPWFDVGGKYTQTTDTRSRAAKYASIPEKKKEGTSLLSTPELLSSLADQSWTLGGKQTRMGIRSGKELRDKLWGFADARHIGIGQVYMVDGSYRDARANAFVTGSGNHSIIGLYDTLFLGQRGKEASEYAEDDEADDSNLVGHVAEVVQGEDVDEQKKRPPRNSAPTQAMNDDEIVAILAHELAHSALKHMQMSIGAQVATSFVTFATMGWMVHSPLAAAALSLGAPIIHVALCAYDHVVGPPLEGSMKLGTDALTRHNEYEADAYAALIAEKYGTGLQSALAKLSVNSNQDPDPPAWYEALHSDHPPFARRWAHIEEVKKKAYGKAKSLQQQQQELGL